MILVGFLKLHMAMYILHALYINSYNIAGKIEEKPTKLNIVDICCLTLYDNFNSLYPFFVVSNVLRKIYIIFLIRYYFYSQKKERHFKIQLFLCKNRAFPLPSNYCVAR